MVPPSDRGCACLIFDAKKSERKKKIKRVVHCQDVFKKFRFQKQDITSKTVTPRQPGSFVVQQGSWGFLRSTQSLVKSESRLLGFERRTGKVFKLCGNGFFTFRENRGPSCDVNAELSTRIQDGKGGKTLISHVDLISSCKPTFSCGIRCGGMHTSQH